MAIPREPRQKMINMMYLVLTALLALNVSSEILNAFKTVNNSLQSSNATVSASTKTIMESLQEKTTKPETAEKANYWYPKAETVTKLAKGVDEFINDVKTRIMTAAKYDPTGTNEKGIDNLDAATRIMVDKGEGKTLYKLLDDFKTNVLKIDPEIAKHFANSLPIDLTKPKTRNKGNNTWEAAYFRMVPTIAALTILSKFQNDVKTSENKLVTFCHEQVGKVIIRYDKFVPLVGQSSNYLMPGQELTVTAGIGAYNSQAQPQISINGAPMKVTDGVASWKTNVGGVGSNSIPILIKYIDQDGKQQTVTQKVEYTVGQTSTSVALDKMNVLFIGVDNPVSIAGSGGAEQIQASITQGSISKVGPGKYMVSNLNTDGECRINVSVGGKSAGSFPFRVRTIPDPTPRVGQRKSGEPIAAAEFRSQGGVNAILENFFYETQFVVTSFRITADGEGFEELQDIPNQGAAWNAEVQQRILRRVRPGSFITIEEIRCYGPDKRTRRLPSMVFNIR